MLRIHRVCLFFFCGLFFFQSENLIAQNNSSTQFWPEIDFTSKPFNKSTIGIDMYSSRASDTDTSTTFGYQSGYGGKIWYNHYFRSKIKTSVFFEPILNKSNVESEKDNMEYRFAVQNVYYSPFKRWTLQNRIRIEDRIIENNSGDFVNTFRPRYMIKAIAAINKKVLIKGTLYVLASNEIMFNTGSSVTGYHFFDRNLTQIGLGYCITDYITIESLYAYTYRITPSGSEATIQAWALTLSINNIFSVDYFKGYFAQK